MKKLRGAVVEWVEHKKTKRRAPIRLDKSSLTFFAWENDTDRQGDPYASKDGREVRLWLEKQLSYTTDSSTMTWIPAVRVEYGGERRWRYRDEQQVHGENVKLEINRFYVGLTRDEREWRRLPWEACDPKSSTFIPENERYAASTPQGEGPKSPKINDHNKPFRLPHYTRDGDAILQYTPELWKGLLTLIKQIELARVTLVDLVGTKEGVTALKDLGSGHATLQLTSGRTVT